MPPPQSFAYAQIDPSSRSDRLAVSESWVRMAPFQHDTAKMVIHGVDDIDATRWTTGTPMELTWGRQPNQTGTFYGYVASVHRNWAQNQRLTINNRLMTVWAVGASYPLKEDLTTVYRNMSSSQIAASLARSHYLDTDIPATSYVWPQKASSGISQWRFLANLAKASGLIMYCNKTQLRMYDPLLPLSRTNTVVPYFYEKDISSTASVLTFDTDVNEVSSDEGRRKRSRSVHGVDASTGTVFYVSDDAHGFLAQRSLTPQFGETVVDMVAKNQASAAALLPARDLENRFYIRAKASFAGDVRLTQMSPVVIEGLGSRNSGLWQILEVTHHYKKFWYSSDCLLGRDSDYDNGVRPGLPSGVARARLDGSSQTVLTNPPTVLVSGQWRAAWAPPTAVAG